MRRGAHVGRLGENRMRTEFRRGNLKERDCVIDPGVGRGYNIKMYLKGI
jgi:hypothetical protein